MLTVNFCGNRVGPMIPVIRKKKKERNKDKEKTYWMIALIARNCWTEVKPRSNSTLTGF